MKIRPLLIEDVATVANLHYKFLPSLASHIGLTYVNRLYALISSNQKMHLGLVAVEHEKIVGVITASRNIRVTNSWIRQTQFPQMLYLLGKSIINRPQVARELLERFFFEFKTAYHYPQPYVTIWTLFVVPSQRRKRVAYRLTREIINLLEKEGVRRIFVDTKPDNIPAGQFYENFGFEVTERTHGAIIYEYRPKHKTPSKTAGSFSNTKR
jgi:ribosomal protein S18 acetylase RimI-like enzyme